MTKRQDSGGTTALVIVCTLVVVLVGVAFFVWMKIIGGGKELQHATDSGNLNVAKQALKSPLIALSSADEANEFGDLVDPSTGQVDLLAYDRLVGKCVLVALNASAEGSDEARTNAEKILAMVEGSNGIGSRLAAKLSQHDNTSGFFTDMTSKASTRMLQSDGQVQANAEETAVSFMARQKASNVFIDGQQVPPEVQDFLSNSNNIVKKNNKQYIAGYTPLAITNLPSVQAQAVPMRPGEQPHLVNVDDFQNLNQSPLGGNSSFIPPNAFRSGGSSIEGNATNANLKMRSCAIVGTLNQDFPVSIPRGYIKIDNTGSMDFSGTTGGGQTALANILMQPSYVGLVNGPSGDVFGKPGTVEGVLDFVNQHKSDNPQPPVPANLLQAVDSPSNMTSAQAYALAGKTVHQCNNVNSISMGPGPHDASCIADYDKFLSTYGSKVGNTNTTANGIMAVEAFKCYVLQVRGSVGSGGCGAASAPAECTGLKNYNINGGYCLPCNFASEGSLRQLLTEAPGATSVQSQLIVRMHQIKPTISQAEVDSVLNTAVSMGKVSYIYQQSVGGPLVLSTNPPGFPINAGAVPDGKMQTYDTGSVNLNGSIVNVPSCEGYPNPWDCPALPANGQNKIQWTPSSGFNNLLGVLRFMNCASGGGEWCCPC